MPRKMMVQFRDPCRKCGGNMFAVPGGKAGQTKIKCFDCGHGALVVGVETAEVKVSALGGKPSLILPKTSKG
jgi:DNA-directed RNA polymerase subunit RPC12/RpoP